MMRSARLMRGAGSGTNSSTSQRGCRCARCTRRCRSSTGMYGPVTTKPVVPGGNSASTNASANAWPSTPPPTTQSAWPLVQVAGVAHLACHTVEDSVLANGVEHCRVPVDPDGVVVVPHGVERAVGAPRAAYGLRILQHLAEPQHAAGTPVFADMLERPDQLPAGTERQVIHQEHVRLERLEGPANHLAPQRDQLLVGDVQETGVQSAIGLLA